MRFFVFLAFIWTLELGDQTKSYLGALILSSISSFDTVTFSSSWPYVGVEIQIT